MTHIPPPPEKTLSGGQTAVLVGAMVPMIAAGGVGGWGTYTNVRSVVPQAATALGVLAAGEGATLVLALVYVGLTLLGQAAPKAVRVGLWALPTMASVAGAVIAPSSTEKIVFGITPMAMCVSAEGIGLLARRIVIHRTGIDMEAQRRNAATLQGLAYHRSRSAGHPWEWVRKYSELTSWRLARHVGAGDAQLGAGLVTVQRERMTDAAGAALAEMFAPAVAAVAPALAGSVTPALPAGAGHDGSVTGGRSAVPDAVTQVNAGVGVLASQPAAETDAAVVTETVTVPVTDGEPSRTSGPAATIADIAAVAGVPTPVPGESLTDKQLDVVLRHLRHDADPPRSYRRAIKAFRDAGYVGGEERVRRAWGELMSREETTAAEPAAEAGQAGSDDEDEDARGVDPRP